MDQQIDHQHPYLIDMLCAITGIALAQEADDLALPMVEAVRAFRPDSPRLDSFEGWLCIRRGDLQGATRHLTAAVEALGPEAGPARALLAIVGCAQGDPLWATQVQGSADEPALLPPGGVDPTPSVATVTAVTAAAATTTPDYRRFTIRG